jgi:hypothetical protein
VAPSWLGAAAAGREITSFTDPKYVPQRGQ